MPFKELAIYINPIMTLVGAYNLVNNALWTRSYYFFKSNNFMEHYLEQRFHTKMYFFRCDYTGKNIL